MSALVSDRRRWPRLRAEGDEPRHLLATRSGRVLVASVAAVAIFTLVGLLALWPYGWHAAGSPRGGTVAGTVEKVTEAPCGPGACRTIEVAVEGARRQFSFPVRNAPSVGVGDHVRLLRSGAGAAYYEFADVDRRGSLLWLAAIFAVVAVALLRWRGALAVLGVVISIG